MNAAQPPEVNTAEAASSVGSISSWLWYLLQIMLILAIPLCLTLLGARLAMTSTFLRFEYNRPGFPQDVYGLTREERLTYAPYALNYLLNNEAITYLEDLTFADGTPLFTERELAHMEDVQGVTNVAFAILTVGGVVFVAVTISLWRLNRSILRSVMIRGSLLTLGGIGVIVMVAVAAWDFFFTAFHQMFFESGTWRFYYSDTLIRLFPEQFWFDAAVFVGAFASIIAAFILMIARRQYV